MPLTSKGEKIKSALIEEYGKEKGERVLYAGKNKGTFTGIDDDEHCEHVIVQDLATYNARNRDFWTKLRGKRK